MLVLLFVMYIRNVIIIISIIMSGEVKSFPYLLQRLAVAVQRGNAVSVLGTFASEDCLVFEDSDAYY